MEVSAVLRNSQSLMTPLPDSQRASAPDLTGAQFAERKRLGGALLVDVRERSDFATGHHRDSVNIPSMEIMARAPFEIPQSTFVVVDCSNTPKNACEMAVNKLKGVHFTAATLNAGATYILTSVG